MQTKGLVAANLAPAQETGLVAKFPGATVGSQSQRSVGGMGVATVRGEPSEAHPESSAWGHGGLACCRGEEPYLLGFLFITHKSFAFY